MTRKEYNLIRLTNKLVNQRKTGAIIDDAEYDRLKAKLAEGLAEFASCTATQELSK